MPLRNLTLLWEGLPSGSAGWDGFSLLIDDVERFRGTATNFSLALLDQGLPHFFRLAVSQPILSIRDSLTCGWLTLASLSSQRTGSQEIIPIRLHSSRTGPGPILYLARLTRLILHCCLSAARYLLSTIHCSFPSRYLFQGQYLVLCLGEVHHVICSLSSGSCGDPFDEHLSSESQPG